MGAWTPLPDTVYPSPADLGGHDGLTAPTETPAIGETWWSWRDAQGRGRSPRSASRSRLSAPPLGVPVARAFTVDVGPPGHSAVGGAGDDHPDGDGDSVADPRPRSWSRWTVFGVGVQCVSGGTTVLHVTPRRQEPTAPTAAVATNNTYRWLSTGTTTPLGDSPPVSIGTAAPAKVLIRTAA